MSTEQEPISDPEGKSTLSASELGDAPGLIAGTSDFPAGREVRMGHLAYQKIGRLRRPLQILDDTKTYFHVVFL